jgi:TolA-binding protein
LPLVAGAGTADTLRARLWAAAANEKGAFSSAAEAFQGTFYARAEAEFGAFVQQFTNSARIPEAVLFQAKARMLLTNYAGAIRVALVAIAPGRKVGG